MKYDDVFLKEIDSTQEYAKKNFQDFNKQNITCIIADTQTMPKGRFGKKWFSSRDSLNISFYFKR